MAVAQTGPDGNLWICVKDNVGNCGVVLKKLEAVLDKVSAENAVGKGFMRRPVKHIRLNLNKKDIQGFSSEVQTYERALAIAFNAINACVFRRCQIDISLTVMQLRGDATRSHRCRSDETARDNRNGHSRPFAKSTTSTTLGRWRLFRSYQVTRAVPPSGKHFQIQRQHGS